MDAPKVPNPNPDLPQVIDDHQLAGLLRVDPRSIRRRLDKGTLPAPTFREPIEVGQCRSGGTAVRS